jgi:hypothetical protein
MPEQVPPKLTCPAEPSTTGAYRIAWEDPAAAGRVARLVEVRPGGDEAVLYEGRAQATTVTGRLAGDYAYRVGFVDDGPGGDAVAWSPACSVAVRPPDLGFALALTGFGGLIVVVVALVILRGHREHRDGRLG